MTVSRTVQLNPWLVLACGGIMLSISFGVRSAFGLFLEPMTVDQGWTRETFALAIAVQNLLWGLSQPVAGAVADKYGTGRVAATCGALYVVGVVLMALSQTGLMLNVSAGLLVGFGLSGTGFAIVLAAIGRAFPAERRSLVLGIGGAVGSLGQFVFPPVSQWLIDGTGWTTALLVLAGCSALMVPLAAAVAGRTETGATGQATVEHSAPSLSAALREAGYHQSYWCLNLGFFVCGFHVAFIATHMPGYVALCGMPASVGALSIALIGLFNVVGSLAAGHLGGRYRKKWLLSGIYFARAVAIALFMVLPPTEWTVIGFSIAIGTLWLSTVPLTSGLVAFIYGPRFMATLFGIVFLSHQIGAFFGAWLGGLAFDLTGGYTIMWIISVLLGLMAAVAHMPIREAALQRAPLAAD